MNQSWLEYSYDSYPRIEPDFRAALDHSLGPRGPELLYDLVGEMGVAQGATVIDIGCGEGKHTITLAERFGLRDRGIDPATRHTELGTEKLLQASAREPSLNARVWFIVGMAEELPIRDASIDLVRVAMS